MRWGPEEASIDKADIFGEHLLSSEVQSQVPEEPFDPAVSNPFAAYLRQLAGDLDARGVVETNEDLSYGSPYGKFPDYDICSEELDNLTNGSADARRALETGYARLSDIPEALMAEDADKARAGWLSERLPGVYRNLGDDEHMTSLVTFVATTPRAEMTSALEDLKGMLDPDSDGKEGEQ